MEKISEHKKRYLEYIKSNQWKSIKKKVISRDRGICQGCGKQNISLEAHHLTYDRLGDELMIDLISLCFHCHLKIHAKHEESEWSKYISMKSNFILDTDIKELDENNISILVKEI